MTRAISIALAFSLVSVGLLALAPTANAMVACEDLGLGGGGIVGRTLEYVSNLEYAACVETVDYVFDVCVFLFGPIFCYSIA